MSTPTGGIGRARARPLYLLAAIVVAATIAATSTPGAALAAENAREVKEVSFDEAQVRRLARPLAAAEVSEQARRQAAAHLDSQMRAGRLVDAANVRVAEIQNPFRAGNTMTLISEGSTVATKIDYVESSQGDGDVVTAAGLQTTEDEGAGAPEAGSYGGGYLGGVDAYNMTTYYNGRYNKNCSTFLFGTGAKHSMTSCYEKWRNKKNTREYIYNRWMLFTVAFKPDWSGYGYRLKDLTIRSREWRGYDRIQQMGDWQPPAGDTSCSTAAEFTLGFKGASLAIPIKKCSYHTVLVDTRLSQLMIGLDRDGTGTDSQYRLDAAAEYIAKSSTTVPVWADYNWATVQFCTSWLSCDPNYSYKQKDSGW